MPEFVVTQTAQEYGAYSKKKAREQLQIALLTIAIGLASLALVAYVLWNMTHV